MSKKKVAIFISGGGSNMLQLLDSMQGTQAASPVLVVSNDPNAAGLARAAQRGVATGAVDHKPFGQDRAAFEAKISDLLGSKAFLLRCSGVKRLRWWVNRVLENQSRPRPSWEKRFRFLMSIKVMKN